MNKIMDGKMLASKIKQSLQEEIKSINKKLKLAVIQVGDNSASSIYVNKKKQLCEEMNIEFELFKFDDVTNQKLLELIDCLNTNDEITGILVQLPLPGYLNEKLIIEAIDPIKDVDGLTSYNMNKLINNEKGIIPGTTLGVLKLLENYNIELSGKHVVIVGRSRLVGIPTTIAILNQDATVTMCHSKTNNLSNYTQEADIIISATGQKNLITNEMIKQNVILIDIGITREDKLYGDIDYQDVLDKCSLITPVPGGVGPMTTIMLINNIIECYRLQE